MSPACASATFSSALALKYVQRAEALLSVLRDVVNSGVGFHGAGIDLEDVDTPGEWIGDGLKDKRRERRDIFYLALDNFFAVGAWDGLCGAKLVGRGRKLDYRVEQRLDSDVLNARKPRRSEKACARERRS